MRQWSTLPVIIGCTMEAACAANSEVVRKHEELILARMRSLAVAEAAYQSVNSGGYDTLECLGAPASCVPNYPPSAGSFLPKLAPSAREAGYKERFHAGPRVPALQHVASASSMTCWAYTAVPQTRRSGTRAFCIDCTGRICTTGNHHAPTVVDGTCASTCTAVLGGR